MSIFLVSKTHIDALVTAGVQWGLVDERDAGPVGGELWALNLMAWAPRGEASDVENEMVSGYQFEALAGDPSAGSGPVIVHKLATGYSYQASEATDWAGSEAETYVAALQAEALSRWKGSSGGDEAQMLAALRRSEVYEAAPRSLSDAHRGVFRPADTP